VARFTDDIRRARQADLVTFLRSRGFKLRREGGQHRVVGHAGLLVSGQKWYCFSTNQGGNALDLAVRVLGLPFREAVRQFLAVGPAAVLPCRPAAQPSRCRGPGPYTVVPDMADAFVPPFRAASPAAVLRYLINVRHLPGSVVVKVLLSGLVYQDLAGACVFPCIGRPGQMRGALLRGTDPCRRFVGLAKGSNADHGWHRPPDGGGSPTVIVVESPIDGLSYVALRPDRDTHVLSLNGLRLRTLQTFLTAWPEVREVVSALDSDAPGRKATLEFTASLHLAGYAVRVAHPEAPHKDWNDQLAAQSVTGKELPR
jgi:hypothetical protein